VVAVGVLASILKSLFTRLGLTPLVERLVQPLLDRRIARFDRKAVKKVRATLSGDGPHALTVSGRWWLGPRLLGLLRVGGYGHTDAPIAITGRNHRLRYWWPQALLLACLATGAGVVGVLRSSVPTEGTIVSTGVSHYGKYSRAHRYCVVHFVDPRDGATYESTTDCDTGEPGDVLEVYAMSGPFRGELISPYYSTEELLLALAGAGVGAFYTVRRGMVRHRMRVVSERGREPAALAQRPLDR